MDHREDGSHAGCGDDRLFRVSRDTGARYPGAAQPSRITSRNPQSAWHHRFHRHLVSSRLLRWYRSFLSAAAVFSRGIRPASAHRHREAFSFSSDRGKLRALSPGRVGLLFLVAAENDSFFLSRHSIARLGADVDGATVLLVCDAIHDWIWSGV